MCLYFPTYNFWKKQMKKGLIFFAGLLLSGSVFATASTGVQVPPVTKAAPNQTFWIFTDYSYSVSNDSGAPQRVAVCYTTSLCMETPNPNYHKSTHTCVSFDLQPGEVKSDTNKTQLEFNYPFNGSCNVEASTEVFGWVHSLAVAKGRLKVGR